MDINMELENKIYVGHSYKLIQDIVVFKEHFLLPILDYRCCKENSSTEAQLNIAQP
jgi:hypothetical protein